MKRLLLLFVTAILFNTVTVFPQGGTTGPLTWSIDDGTLTISGTGVMPDYEFWDIPWYGYHESIHTVIIKAGVMSIGKNAFFSCRSISSIKIPNTVTSIGEAAFLDCVALPSIFIPYSVASIKKWVFSGCTNLFSIDVDQKNTSFSSINGVLFDKKNATLICCPAGKTGGYIIPDGVTSIELCAFEACTGLTSIFIPNSVVNIGEAAFFSCSSLSLIVIPNNVASIGSSAFEHCVNLASITIPNSVTSIGERAFLLCTSLTSIIVPNSVTSISNRMFYGCEKLSSISMPDKITSIGSEAFYLCENLSSFTIPNGVISIGESAFSWCTSLLSVTNLNFVPVSVANNVFFMVDQSACTLKVPIASVSAYKNANVWKEFNIVGIEVGVETIETTTINLYPNPTTGVLNIIQERIESGLKIEDIKIYDISGKIQRIENWRTENAIDISHLSAGVYFVKICTEVGEMVKKVLKE